MEKDWLGTNGVLALAQRVLNGLGFRAKNPDYYYVTQQSFMHRKVPGYNVTYAPPQYKDDPSEALSKYEFKLEILANIPGGKVLMIYNPWGASLGGEVPGGLTQKMREFTERKRNE